MGRGEGEQNLMEAISQRQPGKTRKEEEGARKEIFSWKEGGERRRRKRRREKRMKRRRREERTSPKVKLVSAAWKESNKAFTKTKEIRAEQKRYIVFVPGTMQVSGKI